MTIGINFSKSMVTIKLESMHQVETRAHSSHSSLDW